MNDSRKSGQKQQQGPQDQNSMRPPRAGEGRSQQQPNQPIEEEEEEETGSRDESEEEASPMSDRSQSNRSQERPSR
jgi:hypothetical protein